MLGGLGHRLSKKYFGERVLDFSHEATLGPGLVLDLLSKDPFDGGSWDFRSEEKRVRALKLVEDEKPFLVVGCSPCKGAALQEAREHLKFVVGLCKHKLARGGSFRMSINGGPSLGEKRVLERSERWSA